jgi:hypothetical protein
VHRRAPTAAPAAETEQPGGTGGHVGAGRYRGRVDIPDTRYLQSPEREAADLAWDAAIARIQDANLARLRQEDADADRLFPPGPAFTDALVDDDVMRRLGTALEAYGAAKHTAGRMDLFHRLFDGTDEDTLPYSG